MEARDAVAATTTRAPSHLSVTEHEQVTGLIVEKLFLARICIFTTDETTDHKRLTITTRTTDAIRLG